MSSRMGMDAGVVRQAAGAVDNIAGELDRLVGRADGLVTTICNSWNGADAATFHEAWTSRHRVALGALGVALQAYAKVANENARAQDQASGADGATGPAPPSAVPAARPDANNRAALDQAIAAARTSGDAGKLAFLEQLKQQVDQPNTQLMIFDPAHDRYAVAIGNVSTAQHVAVLVPGVGQDADTDMVQNGIPYSRTIYSASNGVGGPTAVILWKGYQNPTIPEAWSTSYANDGAPALTSFCNGLGLRSDQTLTIIGHSYGSVVTGLALSNYGLHPTNVIALGSPGMGVDGLGELNLRPGQFFDESTPGDLVTDLGYFGTDPSALNFGGTRMSTGVTGALPDPSLHAHSSYFIPGSESMNNIADVVTGNYNLVQPVTPTPGDASAVVVHTILNPLQDPEDAFARGYTGPGSTVTSTLVHAQDSVSNVVSQAAQVEVNNVVALPGETVDVVKDGAGWIEEHLP